MSSSFFLDVGSPRMLSCPDDIVATTTEQSIRVNWAIPGYSDNCEPSCQLSIVSNFQPLRSKFRSGTTNTVHYVAKDPSGNSNRDCVFTVTVKGRNLPNLSLSRVSFHLISCLWPLIPSYLSNEITAIKSALTLSIDF